MAIEWLAGNRLRGTTAERPTASLQSPSVGGWVELGRTSGSRASGATLDVSSLADKRYYMVLYETQGSSTYTCDYRLNGDSGNNYAYRANQNGTSETTNTSTNFMFGDYGGIPLDKFAVAYFANLDTKEKLGISHQVRQQTAGAGTAPTRAEYVHKHAQTSNPINQISLHNRGPNTSTSGEIVVLGWDPDDTHTSNFWEELVSETEADPDVSFTAKKYLWIQMYLKASAASTNYKIRVGNSTLDTGSNYAERRTNNGAADGTSVSQTEFNGTPALLSSGESIFINMFIVNNASNEKLGISHYITNDTGTGAANIPSRREQVLKWTNTSNQIDRISGYTVGGTSDSSSMIKVWGSD